MFLNQPLILWSLFAGAILLVLVDYLFPVDWPAYVGYSLFGMFVGATVPLPAVYSLITIAAVFGLMLVLHKIVFSRFLTNAPRHEAARFQRKPNAPRDQLRNVDGVVDNHAATQPQSNSEGANYVVR